MALFDGLLGGGSADPYDLYGDILTPKQREALRARSSDQTWANAANFLAKAAMPTNKKIPLGGLLAGLAGAMGGSNQDEAVGTALKGAQTTAQIAKLRREQKFLDELSPYLSEAIKRQFGGRGGGMPAPAGVPAVPPTAGAPTPGGFPPPPAGAAPPGMPPPMIVPPQPPVPAGGLPGLPSGATTALPAATQFAGLLGDAPGSGGGEDIWAALAALSQGGGGGSGAPFDLASMASGQGQGLPDLGQFQVEPLGGKAAPAGGVEMPFPTLQNPNKPRDAWAQGVTYDQPKVPYGQAPEDRVRPESGGGSSYGASRADTVAYWRSRGMPEHVAEGIADRVGVESSYRSDAMGDKGTSGGLYQHHADRLARLKSFAASEGKPWTDPDVQHRFAGAETQGGDPQATRAMSAIANAPDRQTAAKLWDRHFERSAAGPGSRLPDVGRVRVEPLGGEATPAGPSGLVPGLGVTPEALALMNAMAKLGGIDSPFGSLLETYYKSPGYLEEKARIEKTAESKVSLEYGPLIKAAETTADMNARLKLEPQLQAAIEKAKNDPKLDFEEKKAIIERLSKEKEQIRAAGLEPVNVTVTFPGDTTPREITITKGQLPDLTSGKGIPALGIPPMSGVKLGKPVERPEDLKQQEIDQKFLEEKRVQAESSRRAIMAANDTRQLIEKGVVAGSYADERTRLLKLGQLLNLTGKDDNERIQRTEAYIANLGRGMKEGLKGFGPPVSNVDIQIAERIAGGQNLTTQGMLELLKLEEKYHRLALQDYGKLLSSAPKSRYDKSVKEPPTFGAPIADNPDGVAHWWDGKTWRPL